MGKKGDLRALPDLGLFTSQQRTTEDGSSQWTAAHALWAVCKQKKVAPREWARPFLASPELDQE